MGWLRRRFGERSEGTPKVGPLAAKGRSDETRMARDPVCGRDVERATASEMMNYEGQTLYFCSGSCRRLFRGNPMKYVMGTYSRRGHGEGM